MGEIGLTLNGNNPGPPKRLRLIPGLSVNQLRNEILISNQIEKKP